MDWKTRHLGPAAIVFVLLAGAGLYTYNTYWTGTPPALEIQGGTPAWDPGDTLTAEEVYFYLRRTNAFSEPEQRRLRAKYGFSFIEQLPGFGYVIKRPTSLGAQQLSLLNDEKDLSIHRIGPDNRKAEALAGEFTEAIFTELGSIDKTTVPVLVTFRKDIAVAAQRALLEGLASDTPIKRSGPGNRILWRIQLTPAELNALANKPEVRWIEPAGPPPQTDLGDAIPDVGGPLSGVIGAAGSIGQVEPCAALEKHPGYLTRMTPDATPVPFCQPVLAEISQFEDVPGFDEDVFDPFWPLWLDVDGDGEGDVCVWPGSEEDGIDRVCLSVPTDDASWKWVKLDSTGPPFPRFIHIKGANTLTTSHFQLCSGLEPGCPASLDTGSGFRLEIVPVTALLPINAPLRAFSPVAHATHVAGIMIGSGSEFEVGQAHAPVSKGMAYEAGIRGFAIGRDPTESFNAYNELMAHDIRVVNNSWGLFHGFSSAAKRFWLARYYDSVASGLYSDGSANGWQRRALIVGSAGNTGLEGWKSARIGNSSKNSIAVASLQKDLVIEDGSSRGPTLDGRITPLISAIGGYPKSDQNKITNVCDSLDGSISSDTCTEIRSTFPNGYGTFFGTSQAAPMVSAAAAMVAEAQRIQCSPGGKAGGTATPGDMNPALVRGILLHTANRIDPWDDPGPDFRSGFGILNAGDAVRFAEESRFQSHTISTGYVEYSVSIDTTDLELKDLRVTLTWDDPPWPEMLLPSEQQGLLHNDLDLELLGPDGRRYLPWILDADKPEDPAEKNDLKILEPVPVAYRDHRNTVEQVIVKNVSPDLEGMWRVRVRSNHTFGANVKPQSFTLVSGAFGGPPCAALTPRVVKDVIWLPTDPVPWYLFWLALLIILLLLWVAWLELRDPPNIQGVPVEVPPIGTSLWRFALFVIMLILIFLTLYYLLFGLSFRGIALAVLIGIFLYFTAP